jgi:hypothetical protein
MKRPRVGNASSVPVSVDSVETDDGRLTRAEQLYRSGQTRDLLMFLAAADRWTISHETRSRISVLQGMALFDVGDVVSAISTLRNAVEHGRQLSLEHQFSAVFALFVREADFQSPEQALPGLTRLRQLASQIGDARSLAGLHLAVARLEGLRGHLIHAHRHLDIARRFWERSSDLAIGLAIEMTDATLESNAGNLARARSLAESGLERARAASYAKYLLGCATNLSVISIFMGQLGRARAYLEGILKESDGLTYIRFGAFDNMARLAFAEGNILECRRALDECAQILAEDKVPDRSWYELDHQQTHVLFLSSIEDWHRRCPIRC